MKFSALLHPPLRVRKKLAKLVRDPRNFFLDLRRLQPLWKRLGVETRHTRVYSSFDTPRSVDEEQRLRLEYPQFSSFDLLGDNWLNAPEKPVAIMLGFNPWKRSLVSAFLPEYRTAFVRGRPDASQIVNECEALQGYVFVEWGLNADKQITQYAADRGIPVLRMEDGFIRSALLGSHHSTPSSLVLDSRGIYFDPTRPSDLENILNEYDFHKSPHLLAASKALLQIVRKLGISKYNVCDFQKTEKVLGPRFRSRVLVIGQVESDASIIHGIGPGWTNLRLIQLAKSENPDAEIIYRPHPDVAHGFRQNAHALRTLQSECRVLEEAVPIADLFRAVDQVYTMTSLSGFEALIHGLPVTVVGAPFYAGWGLTDDRTRNSRRNRALSIEELFCAAYLLYPRYLGGDRDSITGCLAAILHVTAHRRLLLEKRIRSGMSRTDLMALMGSDYWLAAFRPSVKKTALGLLGADFVRSIDLPRLFSSCRGAHFQQSVAYLLAGQLWTTSALPRLLKDLRTCLQPEYLQRLLTDLWEIAPSQAVLENSAWALQKLNRLGEAQELLEFLVSHRGTFTPARESITGNEYVYALRLGQLQLTRRNLDAAYSTFNGLLLSGYLEGEVILGIAEIARLRFDFASSAHLLHAFNRYEPHWKRGQAHVTEFRSHCQSGEGAAALESIATALTHNPQYVEAVAPYESSLARLFGGLPYAQAALLAAEREDGQDPVARARALVAHQRAPDAEALLRRYVPKNEEQLNYCLALSLACSYQGKIAEAKGIVKALLPSFPVSRVYREGLRLAVLSNDYEWGEALIDEAKSREAYIGEMYVRKIAFGGRRIQDALRSFRQMERLKVLPAYLGKRYVQSLREVKADNANEVLIVAFFGPGDEIRFASLYREMREACGARKATFTCDPRLQKLLERHYTDLEFLPVTRLRSLGVDTDLARYSALPGSDLHTMFDNKGWEAALASDAVILATDALADVVDGYDSLKGVPYLKADPARIQEWRNRLCKTVPQGYSLLVGLSWRSSLNTYARSEHYFDVEDLAPLFEVPNVQFVNLQYDECTVELDWLAARYPGRIVNFEDLDQFNDLDGVAALMSCLDLVIAPGTTVFELAGALGIRTWLLSNSSEFHWRKMQDTDVDAWHSSLTHVESPRVGDKEDLISITKARLLEFSLGRERNELAVA